MPDHFHTGFEMFLFAGVSAWIFLALMKIVAALMAAKDGAIGSLGAAIGGTL